ncbi:2488_t:CDS:2, partial [Acaulospora morrowiae]
TATRPPPRFESQNSPGSLKAPSPGVEELITVAGTNTERNTKRAVGKRRRKTNDSVVLTENSEEGASQPCQKKRILPPRKVGTLASVLAEEVAAEQESKEPTVTGETYLMLTSDENIIKACDVVEEREVGEEISMKKNGNNKTEIPVPSFKLWDEDVGSGLRSKAQE